MSLDKTPEEPTPPDPKTASVRADVSKSDKLAWVKAANLAKKPLEDWAINELNQAAREESEEGGETNK